MRAWCAMSNDPEPSAELESATVAYRAAHAELLRLLESSRKSGLKDCGAMLAAAKSAYDAAYDALIAEVWK